jgi:hypothetical protein
MAAEYINPGVRIVDEDRTYLAFEKQIQTVRYRPNYEVMPQIRLALILVKLAILVD